LICLPIKYIGGAGDGAPARTVLREKFKQDEQDKQDKI
jgi:hypothetical protein